MSKIEFKKDETLGYMFAYAPNCEYANKAGKIYEHTYVMCNHIGRRLEEGECVHHIDRDKLNNDISNLMLMTQAEHARLHAIEDRGYILEVRNCKVCGSKFEVTSVSSQKMCSQICAKKSATRFNVTKDELHSLVWSMPTVKVAEMFGVSDVAIAKRCKKLGIEKPPRGYWAKVQAGKI